MKKPYSYFVNYSGRPNKISPIGNGCCEVTCTAPITCYEDIKAIVEEVKKSSGFIDVVIHNYILLDETIHQKFAQHTSILAKPGEDILNTISQENLNGLLVHLMRTVHRGKLLDVMKKKAIYNKSVVSADFEEIVQPTLHEIPVKSLTPSQYSVLHMTVLAVGETAELGEAVLTSLLEGKPLDKENMREEIGDTLFGLQELCNELGFNFESIMQENINKLSKRYPAGYSDKSAQERLDKTDSE